MSASEPVEVEWQFDLEDLAGVERWLADLPNHAPFPDGTTITARAKSPQHLVDRYLDTPDWRIALSGLVLRTRRKGQRDEATLKDTRPATAEGLRRRLEVTEPLGPTGVNGLGDKGPVGRRLALVVGRRALTEILEIHTRRQPFAIRAQGEEIGEVALDDTIILVGPEKRPRHLRRVELEVKPEWVERLTPIVDELRRVANMTPATLSKYESGLAVAGLNGVARGEIEPVSLSRTASTKELICEVLRYHTHVVKSKEPGTRLGEDPEDLHQMRVGVRRLRAAISLFSSLMPADALRIGSELKWLGDLLGAVRDIDVQTARLSGLDGWLEQWTSIDHQSAISSLDERFAARRNARRSDLLDALDHPRYLALLNDLEDLCRSDDIYWPTTSSTPISSTMATLITRRHKSAIKAAKGAALSHGAPDRHALRIRVKRLRYALEFSATLYGKDGARYISALTKLQDRYGDLQDAAVAIELLSEICASQSGAPIDPRTIFAVGALAEHYRAEAAIHLDIRPTPKEVLEGKEWKALLKEIERVKG